MQALDRLLSLSKSLFFSASEESVLADLRWLGLQWDEGPDMDTSYGPYRQSERGELYIKTANYLLSQGKAYRCFCTNEELDQMKAEQEARGETPRYDGRWRCASDQMVQEMMGTGAPYTIRFKVPENSRIVIDDVVRGTVGWDAQATVGDFILLRSSGVPVYNFCVAVDDASMGITTVVRAEEHLTNTVRQALILDALGAPRPRYAHCSLILGEDKQKLSKRHGATSCDQYRLDGFLPDAMINYLALLGWNDGTENEIFTREELIDAFELERVVKSPSVFDIEKLKWVNSQHLKMCSVEAIVPMVLDQLVWEGMLKTGVTTEDQNLREFGYAATALAKQMMVTTKDAALNAKAVLQYGLPPTFQEVSAMEARKMIEKGHFYSIAMKLTELFEKGQFPQPDTSNRLAAFADANGRAIEEDASHGSTCVFTQEYLSSMKSLARELGLQGKNLFHPIRLALTGAMSGQDVTKQLSLLSMAATDDSVIDAEKVQLVSFADRMVRLKNFCETIPAEFRRPQEGLNKDVVIVRSNAVDAPVNNVPSASSAALLENDPKDTYDGPPVTALDIRVGLIRKVWEHPEADKLFCEEIDVGEENPRLIASGLRPFLNAEDMLGRKVLVLCNLKERKMLGFNSHGMVLCASNPDHTEVHLVSPPVDAVVGERVVIPDFDHKSESGQPYPESKMGKKKVFEKLSPYLLTNKYGVPEFLGRPFVTSKGVCTSPVPNASVK